MSAGGVSEITVSTICLPLFLEESNYKMPRLPILSQWWVIKACGLSLSLSSQVIGELQKD